MPPFPSETEWSVLYYFKYVYSHYCSNIHVGVHVCMYMNLFGFICMYAVALIFNSTYSTYLLKSPSTTKVYVLYCLSVSGQLSRLGTSDDMENNMSTFSTEMKETAYILANVTRRSLVIIDELGRGTSNIDGIVACHTLLVHNMNA